MRMYSWLVGKIVRRGFDRFNAGDVDSVLAQFRGDARFVFPGRHSFAADLSDPTEIRAWFNRFTALGPHFTIEDVIASGPPWDMRVAVRFDDRIELDGKPYENQGVQYLRLRWGRIRLDRLFVDTQAVAAFDAELSAS